jgi:sortase A
VAEYPAGYLHGTGLPGIPRNVVLAGHVGLFGGVFANLGGLQAGDDISMVVIRNDAGRP